MQAFKLNVDIWPVAKSQVWRSKFESWPADIYQRFLHIYIDAVCKRSYVQSKGRTK